MTLSRWTDNSKKTMEEILENMLNYENWIDTEKDPKTGEDLRFQITKVFGENQKITINNHEITYNYISYEYEKVRPSEEDNDMRSSRIYSISGYIIIYTDGTNTQYITNRSGNDGTKTILRKLNNYNKKLEIMPNLFRISEDIFTWMIYRVLNYSETSLEDDSHLLLKKIIGFKGSTQDRLAEVKGTGNKIMNLLSTLAFLFENEQVSFINPRIEYQNETIEVSLDLNGTIDIDFESYVGDYLMRTEYERYSIVTLTTFLEIIPKILTSYHNDKDNGDWSLDKKVQFFTGIGESIQEKINEKIALANSEQA
ncbi:hypothetical protein OCF65_18700 [Bacillus toyonensis]|uniref:hypothetical protein n=1 Tax=Bacillus TaxID=1386 RepID=UPI0010BD496D|nr:MULTISPECIES: hypothetical protein [Bacillus cereus group]MCU5582468.1 hypothetical protein [Bacillus toyonensis]TKH76850.1 hypothetical protein FC688_21995 [Bacillus cereus]